MPRRLILGNLHSYTRIPIRYRGVCKRACSPGFREEFFSDTQGWKRAKVSNSPSPGSFPFSSPKPSVDLLAVVVQNTFYPFCRILCPTVHSAREYGKTPVCLQRCRDVKGKGRIRELRPELWEWEKSVEIKDARLGTSVQVLLDYRKPQRRGAVGTIKKRYGTHDYTAFEVLFPDGQSELFWEHQLEEAKEYSPDPSGGGYSGSHWQQSPLREMNDRTTNGYVKVLLADDHTLFRQGLAGLLTSYGGMEVVGETNNDRGAVELARKKKPDVVIMQVQLPFERARKSLEELREIWPPPKIVVVTMFEEPTYLREFLHLGIRAYLLKSVSVEELIGAIRV